MSDKRPKGTSRDADATMYADVTQAMVITFICKSLPMAGRATIIEEDMKGTRKEERAVMRSVMRRFFSFSITEGGIPGSVVFPCKGDVM